MENNRVEIVYRSPDIYRVSVPLKGNALKNLNCYVIQSNGETLVIDTGFNTEDCKKGLLEGLKELQLTPSDTDLFLTHLHSDHTGLSELFVNENHHIYMGEKEYAYWLTNRDNRYWYAIDGLYVKEGFPMEGLLEQRKDNPAKTRGPKNMVPVTTLKEGEKFKVGDIEFECIEVPGHTPGHMCLYIRELKILFLGDHVLYDITPNVMEWPGMHNSLGNYLSSLEKIKKYEVELALPAHRGGNEKPLSERINELTDHHQKRLDEIKRILKQYGPLTTYDVASHMKWSLHGATWDTAPKQQKWFAMGEARAHLVFLEEAGKAMKKEEGGLFRYLLL